MKPSESFEGENSSLRRAFDEATRDTAPANRWRGDVEKIVRSWLENEKRDNYVDEFKDLSSKTLDGNFDFEELVEQLTNLLTTHSAQIVENLMDWIETNESFDEFPEPHIFANDLREYLADQVIDIVKAN
jgi:hypothetical protein